MSDTSYPCCDRHSSHALDCEYAPCWRCGDTLPDHIPEECKAEWIAERAQLRAQLAAVRAVVREARTVVDHTKSHTEGAGCVYTCVACILDAALADGGEG